MEYFVSSGANADAGAGGRHKLSGPHRSVFEAVSALELILDEMESAGTTRIRRVWWIEQGEFVQDLAVEELPRDWVS